MNLTVPCLCRGDGRTYVQLEGTDPARPVTATATLDGRPMPCKLLDLRALSGLLVAVIPVLTTGRCAVEVTELGPDGEVADTGRWSSNAEAIKWLSRLNYKVKAAACRRLRDLDECAFRVAGSGLSLAALPAVDEPGLCEGVLKFAYQVPAAATVDSVTMEVLDSAMNPVEGFEPILMGEKLLENAQGQADYAELHLSVPYRDKTVIDKTFVFTCPECEEPSFLTVTAILYQSKVWKFDESVETAAGNKAYDLWLEDHRASVRELLEQRNTPLPYQPLISVVVPLYKTPLPLFQEMVKSVVNQTYGHWQLVLVNASPEDEGLTRACARWVEKDPRITVVDVPENGGITLNTRAGIAAATGDYIAFFDHDDWLFPEALYEYVRALNEDPAIDVLYCDEDKLSPTGKHIDPTFKPEYSRIFLEGGNYITHFLMIRRSLVEQLEYNDAALDGAQDFGMVLEAIEHTDRVRHVPKILYSWRLTPNSTAAGIGAKPYAVTAGRLALEAHLKRQGIEGTVTELERNDCRYDIRYAIQGDPVVDILIPCRDNVETLRRCLASILERTAYEHYRVWVVENNNSQASHGAYQELLALDPRLHLLTFDGDFNYSSINNYAASQCDGDYLLLLHSDTEVITEGWIQSMLGFCQQKDVGAVGPRLLYSDGTVQSAGILVQGSRVADHLNVGLPRAGRGYQNTALLTREVSAVSDACLLTKRALFEQVGGFDEVFPTLFSDVDYCLKLRDLGYLVVFDAAVELYHHKPVSRKQPLQEPDEELYYQEGLRLQSKWPQHFMNGDPYMNVNLVDEDPYFNIPVNARWEDAITRFGRQAHRLLTGN